MHLNKCPICENSQTNHVHNIGKFFVKCHFCGHQGDAHDSQEGAVALWNGEIDYGVPAVTSTTESKLAEAIDLVKKLKGTIYMDGPQFYDALDTVLSAANTLVK